MRRPFYTTFAWAYDLFIAAPVATRVPFIAEQLRIRGVGPGAVLLDAGCGTGAYSIALAQKGYRVTGFDSSGDMIAEARRKAAMAAAVVRFSQGDVVNLPAGLRVDAILCRGVLNDLVDEDSRTRVFRSLAGATRPGGCIILDVRDWCSTVAGKKDHPTFEKALQTARGLLTFRSVTELQPERHCLLVSETHLLDTPEGRQTVEHAFVMRCWTQDEVTRGLTAAGFESVQCFGDYDAAMPVGVTDRLVAVATMGDQKQDGTCFERCQGAA